MRPVEPTAEQRARDGRLAWIIVGCSAVVTLALLVVGVVALSGRLSRWSRTAAATNASAPALDRDDAVGKVDAGADGGTTNPTDNDAVDLPTEPEEVRKRDSDERSDEEDDASVRRSRRPHRAAPSLPPPTSGPTV